MFNKRSLLKFSTGSIQGINRAQIKISTQIIYKATLRKNMKNNINFQLETRRFPISIYYNWTVNYFWGSAGKHLKIIEEALFWQSHKPISVWKVCQICPTFLQIWKAWENVLNDWERHSIPHNIWVKFMKSLVGIPGL